MALILIIVQMHPGYSVPHHWVKLETMMTQSQINRLAARMTNYRAGQLDWLLLLLGAGSSLLIAADQMPALVLLLLWFICLAVPIIIAFDATHTATRILHGKSFAQLGLGYLSETI